MKINIKERRTIDVKEIKTIRVVRTIGFMDIRRINLMGDTIKVRRV